MRFSKAALIFITSIIFVGVFFRKILTIIDTEPGFNRKPLSEKHASNLKITDEDSHLMWFLQISDIHISIFRDPGRISELREFCQTTVPIIKPSVVLATGDLTDAKSKDNIGSSQLEQEWKNYYGVLKDSKVFESYPWLDIRGNHDNFNVINVRSQQNFFANYSVQGKTNSRSYLYQISKGGELYSFIGVDASLEPGPRRPFNFVGIVDKSEVSVIEDLVKRVETSNSNYTIWFGHFPTSCIIAKCDGGIRALIGKHEQGLVYLCGHLHQMGGLLPNMYTLQQGGFLELEVGDWMQNRMFRLAAIDHGLFSFIDVKHRDWPIILITNPKHAQFRIPSKEELHIIKHSTHIRILVFSLTKIDYVNVQINNEPWKRCKSFRDPLYVAEWNPIDFLEGIHTIKVYARDVEGRENHVIQPFALDETRLAFNVLPRVALMMNAYTIFKLVFIAFFIVSVLPLCYIRYLHKLVEGRKKDKPIITRGLIRMVLRKLWILSSVDRLFWPLLTYPFLIVFGPWSFGYIVEDYLGTIFLWGLYVNGTFLPGSFTFAYASSQLLTFQIPLTFILAHGVDHRYHFQVVDPNTNITILMRLGLHLPFIIILTTQLLMAYFFWVAYGSIATIFGPFRIYPIVLATVLWHLTLELPSECTKAAAKIWNPPVTESEPLLNASRSGDVNDGASIEH